MREFRDHEARLWTVLVGRESYGMQVLLFFPADGSEVLKTLMASDTRLEGQRELDAMSDESLREALRVAAPWSGAAGFGADSK